MMCCSLSWSNELFMNLLHNWAWIFHFPLSSCVNLSCFKPLLKLTTFGGSGVTTVWRWWNRPSWVFWLTVGTFKLLNLYSISFLFFFFFPCSQVRDPIISSVEELCFSDEDFPTVIVGFWYTLNISVPTSIPKHSLIFFHYFHKLKKSHSKKYHGFFPDKILSIWRNSTE